MALFLKKAAILTHPKSIQNAVGIFMNVTRNHWNYQYKPGPYPKTNEEKAKSAAKYGLTIEEYTPYPESYGYGDYPKLPDIGADSKDPHYPYDIPALRRNFNEPLHARAEIFSEDRYDISMRPRIPLWQQWTWFLGVVGGMMFLYFYIDDYRMGRPVLKKQYPKEGPHFMFEPAEKL